MIILYGISNCDSVKKAKRWLDANGLQYTFHDYKKQGVPNAEAERWIAEAGVTRVLNKRGTTWRKLSTEQQAMADTPEGALNLITEHTSLIKRPIITCGSRLLIGFEASLMEQLRRTETIH